MFVTKCRINKNNLKEKTLYSYMCCGHKERNSCNSELKTKIIPSVQEANPPLSTQSNKTSFRHKCPHNFSIQNGHCTN